ncbi:Cupin domain-containing protein [Amycolatopsis echigonensis]|uniref:Cupin domain-containing protein n=1 Tax=Amycolatopsis echigonensis TaxID=2576905 RepID=A0A2N3WHY0_9PSEU|nr:cupin domain-containing protein [Amycolatopsis niigatensis]PKV93477.1 Cupin domain-containing protein [Amycolatopsis niigatensis]
MEQEWRTLSVVEGQPLRGGTGLIRERARAEHGLAYEIRYPAGVASAEHSHDHDSIVHVLEGRLRGTVDGVWSELGPGDVVVHPRGVRHHVEALADSRWIEFKAPLPGRPPVG